MEVNDFNFEIYKKNIFSQYGEDGIIDEILKRLQRVSNKQCCEFGAWDGKFLSNLRKSKIIIKEKKYKIF